MGQLKGSAVSRLWKADYGKQLLLSDVRYARRLQGAIPGEEDVDVQGENILYNTKQRKAGRTSSDSLATTKLGPQFVVCGCKRIVRYTPYLQQSVSVYLKPHRHPIILFS